MGIVTSSRKRVFGALCVCACFASLLPPALGLKPSPIQLIGPAELHRRTDCSFSSSLMIMLAVKCSVVLLPSSNSSGSSSSYVVFSTVHMYSSRSYQCHQYLH